VDVVRRLAAPREPETPAAAPGLLSLSIAGLPREWGIAVA
jgi:hypothetical protein